MGEQSSQVLTALEGGPSRLKLHETVPKMGVEPTNVLVFETSAYTVRLLGQSTFMCSLTMAVGTHQLTLSHLFFYAFKAECLTSQEADVTQLFEAFQVIEVHHIVRISRVAINTGMVLFVSSNKVLIPLYRVGFVLLGTSDVNGFIGLVMPLPIFCCALLTFPLFAFAFRGVGLQWFVLLTYDTLLAFFTSHQNMNYCCFAVFHPHMLEDSKFNVLGLKLGCGSQNCTGCQGYGPWRIAKPPTRYKHLSLPGFRTLSLRGDGHSMSAHVV